MLKQRILTVVLVLPLFLAALYAGGLYWIALVVVCATLGTLESIRLLHADTFPVTVAALIGAYALIWAAVSSVDLYRSPVLFTIFMLLCLRLMYFEVRRQKYERSPTIITAVAASVYPGLFLSLFVVLRDMGFHFFLLAALVTWVTDTGAYFVGRAMGRRPLWKAVSPNKTVEGALGGLLFGTVAGCIFGYVVNESMLLFGSIGLVASIVAQVGDLYESALKRKSGVKDSGTLLPGHGGILDRLDSLFFSAASVVVMVNLAGMV